MFVQRFVPSGATYERQVSSKMARTLSISSTPTTIGCDSKINVEKRTIQTLLRNKNTKFDNKKII
jgi:hypothetical protein